jgi:hypothetical protein
MRARRARRDIARRMKALHSWTCIPAYPLGRPRDRQRFGMTPAMANDFVSRQEPTDAPPEAAT